MRDSDAICVPKSGTVTFRKEPSLPQTLLSTVLRVPEMPSAHAFFSLYTILWCSQHITLLSFSSQPILYSYFRSSCSWRVRIGKIQCWSLCFSIAVCSPSLTQLINHLLTDRSANMDLEQWGISPWWGRGRLQLTWSRWNRGEQIRGLHDTASDSGLPRSSEPSRAGNGPYLYWDRKVSLVSTWSPALCKLNLEGLCCNELQSLFWKMQWFCQDWSLVLWSFICQSTVFSVDSWHPPWRR